MRIIIVSQYAVPDSTVGITRHFALAKPLVARGHSVTIIASSFQHWTRVETLADTAGDLVVESLDGVRFIWVRTPAYRSNGVARIGNMIAFARRILGSDVVQAAGPADVVVGSSPPLFAAWGAARLATRLRVPFVMEVRDLWPASLVHLGAVRPWHPAVWALGRLERWLYRAASRVISVLPGAAGTIRATAGRGDALPVDWVPNGVDLTLIPEPGPTAPHDGQGAEFHVMYAGAHNLANALDLVLDAAGLLQADPATAGVRFTLIGDGPEKPRLQQRAIALGLRNVRFDPPVPKSEIYRKLATADAFILALQDLPLYQHGISVNKLYDYLATAKPVIFAGAAFNDPVGESGGGVVVRPGDPAALARAITEVAGMPDEARAAMGGRGRRYIEEHHDTSRLALDLEAAVAAAADPPTA